jgi:hypothetical protein
MEDIQMKKKLKNKNKQSKPINVGIGMPYLHISVINANELNPLYYNNQSDFQYQMNMKTSPKKYVYGNTKERFPTVLIDLGKNTLKIECYGLHNGINIFRDTYVKTKSIKGQYVKANKRDKLLFKTMFDMILSDYNSDTYSNDDDYYEEEGDDY